MNCWKRSILKSGGNFLPLFLYFGMVIAVIVVTIIIKIELKKLKKFSLMVEKWHDYCYNIHEQLKQTHYERKEIQVIYGTKQVLLKMVD